MIEMQLRQLATRADSAGPFLSLYLDTTRSDESQRDRIRLLLRHELEQIRQALTTGNGHDGAIEDGIRQIEQYVENSLHTSTRGLAIFTCPSEGFFVPFQLPLAVRPELKIGSRPHLRQLAELNHRHPEVVVAMVDGKSARLFDFAMGRVLSEIDLENPEVPRKHDQGGWSQANMQRHVQDHIDRHHKEVAEVLTKLTEERRLYGVILSGQERNVANFRSFLPKRVEEKILGTLHLDIRSTADEIVAACEQLVAARQTAEMSERLARLEEVAQKNGRAALGVSAVVDAANQRKLETLFLSGSVERRGWRCTACGTLGEPIPLGCPACGEKVLTVDLVEALIAAAGAEDADVVFVPMSSILDRYEGIGAFLRF